MIFDEQISRKPDLYPWTKDYIKAMHHGFWTSDEFSFASDIQDFKVKLTPQEKEIIVRTLSAIGQIEIAVKTFWGKLGDNLPHPTLRDLGYVFANVEVIHNDAYSKLLDVLGLDEVFEENLKLEWIEGRVNYLRKYTHRYYKDNKKQFIYAIILFSIFVENISLFSQFYIINWFGKKNVLKDTVQQTNYTIQEELNHYLAGAKIVSVIREEYPELFDKDLEEKIHHEALEAFKAESKIVDWMINGINEEGLSAPILKEYIKNRINESMEYLGFKKVFEIDSNLLNKTKWFDEQISGDGLVDFFFQKPTGYAKKSKSFNSDDLF